MEVQGTIRLIGNTESVGSNGFTKRLIVVDTDEQYSQAIPIDFIKDKCSILDNYNVGQKVKVSINIRGNEYQGKYYVNLQGWRIEKLEGSTTTQPTTNESYAQHGNNDNEHDDLPF